MDFSKAVNQKVKKNIAAKGNDVPDWPRFPSGSVSLDAELGGGVPKGKIIGVVGEYSSAKTALVLKMVAEHQKISDQGVLWIDAEGAWDPRWAKALGVDVAKIDVVRPEYGEQAYNILLSAYEAGFGLGVLDSVAALSSKSEADGDMDDIQVAAMAKINKKFLRKLDKGFVESADASTFIYINQIYHNIGYGAPLIESGGEGLKYFPSVKIWLKSGGYTDGTKVYDYASAIEEGIDVKGQAVKFFIEKNKTAPPKRRGHFWFYFDTIDSDRRKGQIDNLEESIRLAVKYGIVQQRVAESGKKMGLYDYLNKETGETRAFRGKDALGEFIKNDAQAASYIKKAVVESVLGEMKDEEPKEDEKVARLSVVRDDETEGDQSSEAV